MYTTTDIFNRASRELIPLIEKPIYKLFILMAIALTYILTHYVVCKISTDLHA